MTKSTTKRNGPMTKIGGVWSKKDNPDSFSIKLGLDGNKDPKYDLHVELIVKNNAGEVVARQTDGWLTLKDPRQSPFLKEGQAERIPNTLQFDVLVSGN